ncbi:hypothetical protein [Frankia sp. Cj3]|uniref:hypothetical protein n=1 Tax=Frankia sp. Cj3 TaxID=2880976 RepID=UPI001EF65D5D|nr:hypothetical protein [Frankia sp. Cj3]
MTSRQPDPRSLNFAGDVDEHDQPLPMTVEVLQARTAKWPMSTNTPYDVAGLLARSRQMFIDGYYTYENFMDAATRSLQAVEAALRVRFDADKKVDFFKLIERARDEGLADAATHDILHTGRQLRNSQIHATRQAVVTPVIAANIIRTSHLLVAEVFDKQP